MNPESNLFIDGELVPAASGKTYPNISPVTEESLGEVADAGAEDMDRAIVAARRAFDETDWPRNLELRLKCLTQLRDALLEAEGDFKQQISAETGAPLGICGENSPHLSMPISFIDYTLEQLPKFQWSRDAGVSNAMNMKSRRLVEKEPIGVVGCITPWNVPVQINLAKCVPALAAGCTVILKAAPDTPWCATMLGRLVKEHTDMPPGVFNVITASDPVQVGEQLVTDPRVDMISFTGSTAVGKHIMAQAAPTVKKVFLELGGKSANILLDDADLDSALLSSLGVCFHAGQGCAILTRLLVPRSRQKEVEEKLPAVFGFIEYGDPASESQIMGPLVNARQRERVLGYIEKGKAEGARLLLGGGVPEHLEKGYYVEPTVFTDVTNDMTIAREEIFGPVLAVIPYEDEEDAIRIANDSEYGLSGGVWSADRERALAVARRIRAGTVSVNGGVYYGADAPFGGYKQSGIGREMGPEGFEEYLETKTIAISE
ncbi:MAG: aldehyde dehydrogenase family protein [Halioglobus sp.]|nr:aldehyde dehydrogenase family protein [Halioglobus sp.]